MTKTILLLSGPNLNLLGAREPAVYGSATLEEHVETAARAGAAAGYQIDHVQSNAEADLIAAVHAARTTTAAIVINPGAFTHYSYALADALAAYDGVKVELHLSNPAAREQWRRISVVAPVVDGTVAGFGGAGYRLAVEAAVTLVEGRRT